MKAYVKNKVVNYTYPDDMEYILKYLNEHGKILVKPSTIELLYFRFSEERYCASWVCVDYQVLKEFENWLIGINI